MTDDVCVSPAEKGYTTLVVTILAALLVASIGQGFLAWRDLAVLSHSVEELRDTYITDAATLAAIAQQAHANSIHRVEHERQAEYWIEKIRENEDRSRNNQSVIAELRNTPAARPDPFTGTEGRALRDRIERLEQITE